MMGESVFLVIGTRWLLIDYILIIDRMNCHIVPYIIIVSFQLVLHKQNLQS